MNDGLDPYGILLEFSADRAALDGGLHLYKSRDPSAGGDAEISDVRVWFQCKGIQATTLTAEAIESRDDIAVAGLSLDHVQFWYSAPEPVYLIVYLEAIDVFLAADVRDLVENRGGVEFLKQLRGEGQQSLTLHNEPLAAHPSVKSHFAQFATCRADLCDIRALGAATSHDSPAISGASFSSADGTRCCRGLPGARVTIWRG